MAFTIRNAVIGVQAIATTDTTQRHPLGTIVTADDPTYFSGEFIYLKGLASTAVGSWVTYNMDDGSTTLLAANAIGPVAVAMSGNPAKVLPVTTVATTGSEVTTLSVTVTNSSAAAGDTVTGYLFVELPNAGDQAL